MKREEQEQGPRQPRPWFRQALAGVLLLGLLGPGLTAQAAWGDTVTGGDEVRRVVPVGRAVGIKLFSDGVLVVGFS